MIIPIPTSLPRSSSIDQTISDQSINAQDYDYLIESERARGSDVGIGIIISSVTISKLGITSTLHGLFISKKFFAYHTNHDCMNSKKMDKFQCYVEQ